MGYSVETIAAARRVSDIFASGCDRCDKGDLDRLEAAGLMERGQVELPSDTLEIGDEAWFFSSTGDALVSAIRGEPQNG